MPEFNITAPDGKKYKIKAPEGTTREQALQRFQNDYSGQSQAPIDQAPKELGGMDRARGVGTALAGGATFGWGDEISSGMAAGIAKLLGDEKDYSDIYDDIYAAETDRQKSYEEAHPLESMGLNVAGGLTTGGMGAAKLVGKAKGPLRKALTAIGVGAGEGSIAGAGYANEDERLKGAGEGAAIGSILPTLFSGGKGILKGLSNKRVEKELTDEAGDFLPINLVMKEGEPLQNIYQKIVGPSFGGQKLRDQNRVILDKAIKAANKAKTLKESAKTSGKSALDKTLRQQTIKSSIPSGISEEVRKAINNTDGQDAIKALNKAWKDGFKVVKDKTFKINPSKIIDDAIEDLDNPVDADFVSKIKSTLNKRLGQGFKPDSAPSDIKYRTKGMGSEKIPDIKLDTGDVDGAYLMQARNDLKIMANELGDEGSAALEKSALRKAADKIDDQIRSSLDGADAKKFDDELSSWGNYQIARGSVSKATQSKQGLWSVEDQLSTVGKKQRRSSEMGEGFLQQEGQKLQTQGKEDIESLTNKFDLLKEAENKIKKVIPNLNPDPWSKAVSTATLSAPFLPTKAAQLLMPIGYGIGKTLSTQPVQKAIAGQYGGQKLLANILRGYDASKAPVMLQNAQGAGSRTLIDEIIGD